MLFLDDNATGGRWRPRILPHITKEALAITEYALRHAVVNGAPRNTIVGSPLAAINKALRRRFAKPDIVRLVRRCFASGLRVTEYDGNHPVTVAEYNFAIQLRITLQKALGRVYKCRYDECRN